MIEATCCITGHRHFYDNRETIKEQLIKIIIPLIEEGIVYFGVGGARGFDLLAAETVIELRKIYTDVRLILVLPYKNHTEKWQQEEIELYNRISASANKIKVLSPFYYKGCMLARNKHLVNNSTICICYKRTETGGTAYTVNYARKMGVKIREL